MPVKYHYNSFPPKLALDSTLNALICEARTELGRYDGFLLSMYNRDILLSPLFTQEAVLSSRIEGTQSSLSEVLAFEAEQNNAEIPNEKRNDIIEILNYRRAMFEARDSLINIPLSQRIFKQAHKTLMEGARGQNKDPAYYRKIPVWIGGTNLENARFIPIDAQHIDTAMQKLENYIHHDKTYDPILKIALLHAEFEAIHPFLDGNGRLGRMVIPLYLWQEGLLNNPSFYMSSYIDKHRTQYYDLLLNVSANNDWSTWCSFFIQGIVEQARDNSHRAQKIVSFYNQLKEEIPKISRSTYGITALDFVFKHTYFSSRFFYERSGVPRSISKNLLDKLTQNDILSCVKGRGRRPSFYMFKKLIDIADGK